MDKPPKIFFTYDQQLKHLKDKGLIIEDEAVAIGQLKQYSYYSSISAYKGIFKTKKNGNYEQGTCFHHIIFLYLMDRYLRDLFLHNILIVENRLKSLYSYAFCEIYGGGQSDYLNVNNYDYGKFQRSINEYVTMIQGLISNPKVEYIQYNLREYNEVPFWVLIHALTFGNISKLYEFSTQTVQQKVAKEFEQKDLYAKQLVSMLKAMSKFRNVCAHSERLYSYKTNDIISDMPVHESLRIGGRGKLYRYGKKDLFSVVICLKYLLPREDFVLFFAQLQEYLEMFRKKYSQEVFDRIRKSMGFPLNWQEIAKC